jgi:hypothetical protein
MLLALVSAAKEEEIPVTSHLAPDDEWVAAVRGAS